MDYKMQNFFNQNIGVLIIAIIASVIIVIGLFFLIRVIALWYFKINKIINELKRTNDYLAKIAYGAQPIASPGAMPQGVKADTANMPSTDKPVEIVQQMPVSPVCRQCGAVLQDGAIFCVQCGTKN